MMRHSPKETDITSTFNTLIRVSLKSTDPIRWVPEATSQQGTPIMCALRESCLAPNKKQ